MRPRPARPESDETTAEGLSNSEITALEEIEADTDGSLDDADAAVEITELQRGFSVTSDVRADAVSSVPICDFVFSFSVPDQT